jgi:hypothetical protein
MLKTAILLAIFIVATPSLAQWDSRFWPANEKPARIGTIFNRTYQSDIATSNIYDAVNERIWAIAKTNGVLYSEYPFGPRFPDRSLEELKFILRPYVKKFLDQSRFPVPNQPSSVVQSQTNNSILLTYWNETNLLNYCQLPLNFFTYTPPRNLAGHPGTGSAHWTNSAAYGWDAIRKVLTNLIYTYENAGILWNETKSNIVADIDGPYVYDPLSRPSGSCGSSLGIEGPYPVSELSLAEYRSGIFYQQSVTTRIFYDWLDRFADYNYKHNVSIGEAGYRAAYVGPIQSPISTNAHSAYSFFYESGRGPEDCGFPPTRQIGEPEPVILWKYDGKISSIQKGFDDSYFVIGPRFGIDTTCDAWSYLEFSFGIGDEVPDFSPIFCERGTPGGRFIFPSDPTMGGGYAISSVRTYHHIIEWNFTYK